MLTAENWVLAHYDDDPEYGGELEYNSEDGELAVHWRLAEDYDDYVADRQDIGPATTLDVLGKESLMWSYADDDHTVIRPAGTARSWSALKEMVGAGDMAQWVWEENDQIADGVSGEELQQLVDNCDQT